MDSDYHVQFCDSEANQDISGSPSAERDATEIRLWSVDSTLVCAVEKNARSGMWHVSGSDVSANWTSRAHRAYRNWQDAMMLAGPVTRDQLADAGY
jgi:hypothetical protein